MAKKSKGGSGDKRRKGGKRRKSRDEAEAEEREERAVKEDVEMAESGGEEEEESNEREEDEANTGEEKEAEKKPAFETIEVSGPVPEDAKSEVATLLDTSQSFSSFGLDSRLLTAVAKAGFHHPTVVQSAAIPLALAGKDVLARARTGSGKTAAYLVPILQQLIQETDGRDTAADGDSAAVSRGVRALILVPSAELSVQVLRQAKQLAAYAPALQVIHLARSVPFKVQKRRLAEQPDIVVTTPTQLLPHLRENNVNLRSEPGLGWLVLDEADLLLSYGYEADIQAIVERVPKMGCQTFLMSATLEADKDLEQLKGLVLHNPAVLKLEEAEKQHENSLKQFDIRCAAADRQLIVYALIKLRLVRGKIIFFVNDINHCYRLKLFLERFSIKSAVLNSELPQNSRNHIVMQFNKGIFDFLIATDEQIMAPPKKGERKVEKGKGETRDQEYLVARGVDFKHVKAVVNYNLPPSCEAYIHRIGRTARGGARGIAISFVTPEDEATAASIAEHLQERGMELKPFAFNMSAIEGFRYRVEDMSRSVTRSAIREARIKELKAEILNSARLQAHFEDNPKDLTLLQHDQTLQQAKVQPHLKYIPSYLMPDDVKSKAKVPTRKRLPRKRTQAGGRPRANDPLKTFTAKRRKKD
mmetsp:Transcript_1253/g.4480  ORF Transcript_1253/g.4480 Transcript_1253/m.4480 type:complete len:643 (+) Transcript_1253:25-1953(+)